MDSISGISAAQQQNWSTGSASAATPVSKETEDLQTMLSQQEKDAKSLVEMMREAREKMEEQRKSLEKLYKNNRIRYGDAPIEAYSRLARAKNRTQVNSASGYARRRIAQLKRALHQDSDNASAIRGAISQLQKTLNRAEKKKRDLDRESLLETRRARSAQEKQEQKEQRLRMELKRRKTQRMIREAGYLREAEIDKRLHSQMVQTQLELRQQVQALAPSVSPEAAAQQYAASAASASPVPAPEINIES